MTASDLMPRSRAATDDAGQRIDQTWVWGWSSVAMDMPMAMMNAAIERQSHRLRFLQQRQSRGMECLGGLWSAQSPLAAMGTFADYMRTGLNDWMTEAMRSGASLALAARIDMDGADSSSVPDGPDGIADIVATAPDSTAETTAEPGAKMPADPTTARTDQAAAPMAQAATSTDKLPEPPPNPPPGTSRAIPV